MGDFRQSSWTPNIWFCLVMAFSFTLIPFYLTIVNNPQWPQITTSTSLIGNNHAYDDNTNNMDINMNTNETRSNNASVSINSRNNTNVVYNSDNPHSSTESYLNKLLFKNNPKLVSYFSDADNYTELYNLPNFRRSRIVFGDVSRLRLLLKKLFIKQECIDILALGGSVTSGRANRRYMTSWIGHLKFWLNTLFDCQHNIEVRAASGISSDVQFWSFNKTKNYDLIIMETATNYNSAQQDPPMNVWHELLIRQLLLLPNEPAIISLHATNIEPIVLGEMSGNNRGDMQELINLNYYQIPTISLSTIIFPLCYRYYFNSFMNPQSTPVTKTFYQHSKYLFVDNGDKKYNDSNYFEIYHDERYSYESHGGHLRSDHVHPTLEGQKYIALIVSYLLVTEYNNLLMDMNFLNENEFNLFYKNKLWLHPTVNSLPPILFKLQHDRHVFEYMANTIIISKCVSFGERRVGKKVKSNLERYLSVMGYKDLISENEGVWNLVNERGKWGLICNEPINCKLSINISNAMKRKDPICNNSSNKLLIAMQYLKSYNNMGTAMIQINNMKSHTDSKSNGTNFIVDALLGTKISPSTQFLAVVDCENINKIDQDTDLFFHLQIIDSNPPRLLNKFKLISLKFHVENY
eukprot:384002_1